MADLIFLFMVGAVVCAIAWAAYHFKLITQPLQKRMAAANPVRGKTRAQIEEIVGKPNSFTAKPGGKSLLQWIEGGYHVALLFDEKGICEGVSHEFSA